MRLYRFMMILWAFYFTFIGGSTYYAIFFPVRVLHHLVVTLLLGLWLLGRIRKRHPHAATGMPETGLNGLIYALVGWWFITAIAAHDPRMAFEQAWFLVMHVLLFFVVADNLQRGRQRLIMETLVFMAAVVILLTGIELASWYFGLNITPGTNVGWAATGTLPHLTDFPQVSMAMGISTLLAGYTTPLIIVTAGWALTVQRRDYRVVLWLMMALLAGVLLFTSSRGGALSLMAATGTLILTQLMQNPRITARISPSVIAGGGIILAIAALGAFVILTLPNANRSSDAGRQDMWQSAVRLTLEHPLTGVGIGMFGRAFRDVRNPAIAQDKLASAHNVYLNTAAETGLPGTLLGAALVGSFLQLAWQNWQKAASRGHKFRIQVTFAALVGIAVHSMVDVFTITPIVLLIVTLTAYTIIPQPASRLTPIKPGQRLPALSFLIIIFIYGVWLLRLDQAQAVYQRSFNLEAPTQALLAIDEAMAIDPYLRLYPLQKAFILGEVGQPDEAIQAYQHVLMLEPTWDVGWINLAALLEQQRSIDKALTALNRAAEISHYNVAALNRSRLAEAHHLLNSTDIVAGYLQSIQYHFHLTLPLSDFWHESPLRLEALRQFTMGAPIELQYRIWSVHAPQTAAALIPENPQTAMDWWVMGEHALSVENDAQKAADYFSQAILLTPKHGDYYASRARALLASNPAAAKHNLDLAQVYGTRFEPLYLIRAQLATTPEAAQQYQKQATQQFVRQEFAAVLYARPAVFDVLPQMRYPVSFSGIVP